MSSQKKYWEEIHERYKVSGLSQMAFCKQNELSWNQFKYRWYQHNLELKAKARAATSIPPSSGALFEPVMLALPSITPKQTSTVVELALHFPNQIRCDVKIDLCANELSTLFKQLVALC